MHVISFLDETEAEKAVSSQFQSRISIAGSLGSKPDLVNITLTLLTIFIDLWFPLFHANNILQSKTIKEINIVLSYATTRCRLKSIF